MSRDVRRETAPARARAVLDSPGRSLDPSVRGSMEARFGQDFGRVRVHTDAGAAASARTLDALAYTVGSDIAFAAGRYAPGTSDGRLLLAHELTHVVQQRDQGAASGPPVVEEPGAVETEAASVAERASQGERVEVAQRARPAIARQSDEPAGAPALDATSVIWFELGSDELRRDTEVDSIWHLAIAEERIQHHYDAFGESQQILVHGYASVEGSEGDNIELSGRRAIRVKNILIDADIDSRRIVVLAHGADASLPGLEWNRRVEIELLPPISVVEFEGFDQPAEVRGAPCSCPAGTAVDFDGMTIDLVKSMATEINRVAAVRGIPPVALAGAIAEEYQARRGIRVPLDATQDAVLDALWEWQIDVDRYLDIHSKLLNALENDIGKANFNVRTALSLVEAGEVEVRGSPPSDPQVELIVDLLLDEVGTIEFSGAYLAHAQSLFAPFIGDYDIHFQEAVLVEYFNQGDKFYGRFLEARAKTPGHTPCPGDAGCAVLYNRAALENALEAPSP